MVDGIADTLRFASYSGMALRPSRATLEARIIMEYHRIEKGLTLRERRPWFGEGTVNSLLSLLEEWNRLQIGPSDDHVVPAAVGALRAYFAGFGQVEAPSWVASAASRYEAIASEMVVAPGAGGTEIFTTLPESNRLSEEFVEFVLARHSIRNYSQLPVEDGTVASAIALAATSPSVCNRQATRVRRFRTLEEKRAILAHQNGNRGFGEEAAEILLITTDLTSFVTPGERSQGLIDGGMFCMTLIYALHADGVGTCCLNWSASTRQDRRLRQTIRIKPHERVVMLMALGYPALSASVAMSTPTPAHRIMGG